MRGGRVLSLPWSRERERGRERGGGEEVGGATPGGASLLPSQSILATLLLLSIYVRPQVAFWGKFDFTLFTIYNYTWRDI